MPISAPARIPESTASGSLAAVKKLDRLSVSEDGRLYWDGKPVVVRRRIQLSPWQTFGAILIGLAATLIVLSGIVQLAVAAHDGMCRAKWVTGCAVSPAAQPARPAPPEIPN
jgi:hypothetical protein